MYAYVVIATIFGK